MTTNLASKLDSSLSAEPLSMVHTAGELCRERGEHLYLVGGVVRDLILGRPNFDLDLVVEGEAEELARSLVQARGGEVVMRSQFGTVKVRYGDLTLDFATARSESYSRPGALPTVSKGSIKEDLLRRDFTINAMAMKLDPEGFGEVLDPCGGQKDIEGQCIRILHEKSFIDDATRMLRAIRYEQRLGFRIEPKTEGLLRRDIAMLNMISGDRLRRELELIFKEEEPEKMLLRADDLGVLPQIHPALGAKEWFGEKLRQARSDPALIPLGIYFPLLVYHLAIAQAKGLIERLNLPKTVAQAVEDTIDLRDNLSALEDSELPPSGICRLLEKYNIYSVMTCVLAVDESLVSQRMRLYLDKLRHVKPLLKGKALQEMGLAPGARLGEIIQDLRWAKIDGRVKTKKDEEELVLSWLKEGQGD